jgi:hypothetical protein
MTVSCRRSASDGAGASRGVAVPGAARRGAHWGAERSNGRQQFAAVADEADAEVLEVVGGQLRQYRGVDRVVAKRLFVLLHAEAVEPGRDVHVHLPDAALASSSNHTGNFGQARLPWRIAPTPTIPARGRRIRVSGRMEGALRHRSVRAVRPQGHAVIIAPTIRKIALFAVHISSELRPRGTDFGSTRTR